MNATPTSPVCPDCGAALPTASPDTLCAACLLRQALVSRTLAGDDAPSELPPPSPEEIAGKFPQFEINECLGRGGMGVVYKARQKSLDRWVAIKILPPERVGEMRFAERFAREAQTLARLNHPNIVTVFDYGETDGLFYIVMEYIDGVNLRDLLRDGKLEPKQALAIVPPICDALQYAHDKGIVHRDIKPENLLLDRDGRIKIADFGIATLVAAVCDRRTSDEDQPPSQTAATVPAGTHGYSAPEQANGSADHRADIYALGVVLYEMLTGERPNKELVAPSKKVQIDVRLDEIVLRALEKTPELRYQTAAEFRTVLETMAETPSAAGSSVSSHQPPPRLKKRVSMGRLIVGCALFGLLMAVREEFHDIWLRAAIAAVAAVAGFLVVSSSRLFSAAPLAITAAPDHAPRFSRTAIVGGYWLASGINFVASVIWGEVAESKAWPAYATLPFVLHLLAGIGLAVAGYRRYCSNGRRREEDHTEKSESGNPVAANPLPVSDFWEALEACNYGRAWDKTALYFQRDQSRNEWIARMEKERRPLGRSVDRKLVSTTIVTPTTRTTTEILTTFENGQQVVEGVCSAVQADGEWKVEKYYTRPVTSHAVAMAQANLAKFSRFSRAAIVGACWLAFVPLHFVLSPLMPFGWAANPLINALAALLALLFWMAPAGVILLGWIAVAQIRRSAGKLYGMWLAVFDGLLFPLLAVDAAVILPVMRYFQQANGYGMIPVWAMLLIGLGMIALIASNVLLIRWVWRKVNSTVVASSAPGKTIAIAAVWLAMMPLMVWIFSSKYTVWKQEKLRIALEHELGNLIGTLLAERRTTCSKLAFAHESPNAPWEVVVHCSGLESWRSPSGESLTQPRKIKGDIILNYQPPNEWSARGTDDLIGGGTTWNTGTRGFPDWPESPKNAESVPASEGAPAKPATFKPIPAEAARLLAELKGLPVSPAFAGKDITSPEVMKEFQAEVAKRTAAIEQLLSGTAAEPLMKQQKDLLRQIAERWKANPADANDLVQQMQIQGKQLEAMIEAAGSMPENDDSPQVPSQTLPAGEKAPVVIPITIAADGTLTVADQPCPPDQLGERLRTLAHQDAASVVVHADEKVPFQQVQAILDACKAAGISAVSLAMP